MYTGTLMQDLMEAVQRAEARAERPTQERRFYVWDADSHEESFAAQISLAGVA